MKTIDGEIFRQMIISAANNLYNCYPEIDALNVFPVPDGDTGTNMNLTLSSGAKEVANKNENSISEIAKVFSRGLLMGARGNSGVILSQIFRGFSQGLNTASKINARELADAFISGKTVAYKAVIRPVEGTILTVIREASDALFEKVNNNPNMGIDECMDYVLKEARESLKRTPDLLPVLKEVGVVDSGGAGLCKILEGFAAALHNNIIEKAMPTAVEINNQQMMAGANVESDEEYGYCTEFLLRIPNDANQEGKKEFIESRFKAVLQSHGNSLVVVKDDDIVKVHVHTLMPGNILTYAQQFGEFIKLKIENMTEQHSNLENTKKEEKIAEKKEFAIISVAVGDGIVDLFKELNVDYVVSGGQTMNPSTEDFIEAIKKVNAEKVIILPNNSNIIMAASQACEVCEEGIECKVIPSKTIPQGLVASMMFNPEVSLEENVEEMTQALGQVKTGQVTYAIKDTTVDGVNVYKNQYMGLFGKSIVCCNKEKDDSLFQLLEKMVDDMSSIITIFLGEDVEESALKPIEEKVKSLYPSMDVEIKVGKQPVYSYIISVE